MGQVCAQAGRLALDALEGQRFHSAGCGADRDQLGKRCQTAQCTHDAKTLAPIVMIPAPFFCSEPTNG